MEMSKSEKYLLRKGEALPTATPDMVRAVSQHRREGLEEEMHEGKFTEGSGSRHYGDSTQIKTPLGNVVSSVNPMKKFADSFTSSGGGGGTASGYRGSGGTFRQVPEVYSPLWLNSNLNLPRDRATINAWSRSFFALNPIVQNAISLHSTYPISKLNIKCKNPVVNAFFENMIDEIDLENICVQIAQEYWTLGEAFVYAELNESSATWSSLLIQNPDYITVKRSVIAGEPIISLRPDENLRRICTGNRPADLQQRQQLDKSIVEHVRRGEDIPLSNFYASHIARKISPYEVRGTGLPVSCFRQLMLFDKLRECYSTDSEVLTTEGFKRIDEITEISTDPSPKSGYVNGVQLDENNNITGVLKLKDGIKVACFNKDTEELEYHVPEELHMSKYTGKMLHFHGEKIDVLVTPNHKMWASQRHGKEFGNFEKIKASDFDPKKVYRFKSVTNWEGMDVEEVDVGSVNEVDYDDIVWCLTVPTGLFVTRRNNRITIQGNSKFAQADNMINPLTLVKVGGGGDNYKPSPADLEMWRQIFEECHDEETEVLTKDGFKKFDEAIEFEEVRDGTTGCVCSIVAQPKPGMEVACFNPDNEELEYHTPSAAHVYDYDGDMYHFHNNKMDIKVTPNHKMWVQSKKFSGTNEQRTWEWDEWRKILSKDLYNKPWDKRFRAEVKWAGKEIDFVEVCGEKVPAELYLEFLGYFISEGHLGNGTHEVSISQAIIQKDGSKNENYSKIEQCVEKLSKTLNKTWGHSIQKDGKAEYWNARFSQKGSKDLYRHLCDEIGSNDGHRSPNKVIPKWVLDLSPRLLQILLDALVVGDGSDYERPVNKDVHGMFYYTSSKQLADDVYEVAYKLGYVPTMFVRNDEKYMTTALYPCYTVQWSNSHVGTYPLVTRYSTDPRTKEKTEVISKVNYQGKVWCFTVPTGLFITRRNGKITIQSNSQYDKDFKIFTHDGVTVDRVGFGQGIYDISGDVTQLLKEIYIGLMVPQVIMDSGDVTYANGGVALDVLRQRYMQFRNTISSFLRRKIFAPISKINDFYDIKDGEKVLIVPTVEWNHMSLFDMGDYIQNLSQLLSQEPRKVSVQTLYKSLGLEYEDEQRKIRRENIDQIVQAKEMEAMQRMSLNDLRSIGEEDEIQEITESPLPGEQGDVTQQPGMQPGAPGGDLGLGGPGMGGLGMPPPMPPMGGGPGGPPPPAGGPPGGGAPPPAGP